MFSLIKLKIIWIVEAENNIIAVNTFPLILAWHCQGHGHWPYYITQSALHNTVVVFIRLHVQVLLNSSIHITTQHYYTLCSAWDNLMCYYLYWYTSYTSCATCTTYPIPRIIKLLSRNNKEWSMGIKGKLSKTNWPLGGVWAIEKNGTQFFKLY